MTTLDQVLIEYDAARKASDFAGYDEDSDALSRIELLHTAVMAALKVADFGNQIGDDYANVGYRALSVIKQAFFSEAKKLGVIRDSELRVVNPTHPYIQMLEVAVSLGWPEAYERDLFVHDFNETQTIETSFYWAIGPSGTHLHAFSIDPVLKVYGDQCQYFVYNRTENKLKPCDIKITRYSNAWPREDIVVRDLVVRK